MKKPKLKPAISMGEIMKRMRGARPSADDVPESGLESSADVERFRQLAARDAARASGKGSE